jgi:hypothetical protein
MISITRERAIEMGRQIALLSGATDITQSEPKHDVQMLKIKQVLSPVDALLALGIARTVQEGEDFWTWTILSWDEMESQGVLKPGEATTSALKAGLALGLAMGSKGQQQ